jgi:hypothetical protein
MPNNDTIMLILPSKYLSNITIPAKCRWAEKIEHAVITEIHSIHK